MTTPKRIKATTGEHALVDGIPFQLPIRCVPSPVLMAAFPIDLDKAKAIMPAEIHPFRLWNKALLVVTVINYLDTNIGKYVEYSIAIACTHGLKPAPRLLPALFTKHYKTGQYVIDLPVSSAVSVKGGKGIWGMPKHQANLDFNISDDKVSSQYDLDNSLVAYIEIEKPKGISLPANLGAANYSGFRGLLMKSYIYFKGKTQFALFSNAKAKLVLGDHPKAKIIKDLGVKEDSAIMTAFIPNAVGTLDDHFEGWFLHQPNAPIEQPEGFQSVINLNLSEEWLSPPNAAVHVHDSMEVKHKDRLPTESN